MNGVPKRFKGYCTDVFFEEAMAFATAHKDEPFFTYIACNAPHSPFNVANRYSDRYAEATAYLGEAAADRANFYGMVTCIDDNVQRMREHLQQLGVLQDTIFVRLFYPRPFIVGCCIGYMPGVPLAVRRIAGFMKSNSFSSSVLSKS